ncbi:Glycosyl transferase family protein [Candidatus Filomicrobium marinum]|uniref:Glycosyl transferase family protein n=1 Tax=Candidatus Filomicrobium marinum TaxID=1608628 RepID=A0A0D6JJA7_9HYPH|nr:MULTISPECIES: glycosyltransferase [Filomicrobium]MCV0371477.1 glycosyltransferase [Filomicrobium sp.]CFX36675.1 Glycosyl transferase family protein [Candidatus Filomicrobium marinum]CPR21710.1 Glycosyl transferase family protein [Candidatus Filomicrobium marinum]
MTQQPLVTCGVTAFNAAETIERALMSVLAQTWRPLEVVVVDDASDDDTVHVLENFAKVHPEVRVFRLEENGGVAVARNRILAEARGEFVAFFDDDDESLPERLAIQIERIVDYERDFADGAPVICHAARRVLYPDGTEKIAGTMGEVEGALAPSGKPVAHRILMGTPLKNGYGACATCSQCARLSTYRHIGGFDPVLRRSEDTDFNVRLALSGGHFVGVARPLIEQTMTATSDKSLAAEYENLLRIIEKHRQVIEEQGQYEFCRSWMSAKQAWLERRYLTFGWAMSWLALTRPVLTSQRFMQAVPHVGLNVAFRQFHSARHPQ